MSIKDELNAELEKLIEERSDFEDKLRETKKKIYETRKKLSDART